MAERPAARRGRRRVLLLGAALLAALLLGAGARAVGALDPLERSTVDTRFQIRGDRPVPGNIVIVSLDAASLAELNQRPPIARGIHARMLDRLHSYGPKLIAFDVQFAGVVAGDRAGDRELIQAVDRDRPVLLATHVATPPLRVPAGAQDPDALGAVLGSVTLLNDPDGKIRKIPYGSGNLRSFPVAAAEQLMGRRVDRGDFPAVIDYRGKPGHFPTYSYTAVLDGKVPASAFRGKLVLVGTGDPIEKDVFGTPVADLPMAGVEIHANSIATILEGFDLRESATLLDLLLLAAMAAIVPLASLRLSPAWSLAVALAALGGYLVLAQVVFDNGRIVDVTYPLLALVIATIGSIAAGLLTETRERLAMRRIFSRFVPESVVEDVMQRADADLRLGGTTLDATVLFCDLRGFTTFAESRTGAEVIEALNHYLSEMSDAVLAHGGTVVSYMGDGMMAVFGAPIEQPDHADRALAAASEMIERRLPAFNDWFRERGLGDGFLMGIGLASGPVQSGNVGSERRIEYAAVGDTTNVAARLEAKTKDTDFQLLVSDATRERLTGPATGSLVSAGEFVLKGRSAPTAVWSLELSARPAAPRP